jgi:methionyl-tRNA formyltransferase
VCATLGGKLLARSLWQLYDGSATLTPQDETKSSYLPMPAGKDYVVMASEWEARRVYNFIRGIGSRGELVTILTGGQSIRVTNAISYSQSDTSNGDSSEEIVKVRCLDGWVCVT